MAVTAPAELLADATVDAFIGGRVEAVQAGRGHHRSGLEAVLLGASLPRDFSGAVVDLGAGTGVAGMVAAARCPSAWVLLVDSDAVALRCAASALTRPANEGFAARVAAIEADITAPEAAREAAGLQRESVDAVITNPPFHLTATTRPPEGARAAAHILGGEGLEPWLRAAASVLKPGGFLVVAFRADQLAMLLSLFTARFGSVDTLPIHPRAAEPAHRVLVRGVKGSRAASRLLPPLVLHGERGSAYLPSAQHILRDGAGLADIVPLWGA
jgi:tRNA1(Val) A37 N6-methylase TrmN6